MPARSALFARAGDGAELKLARAFVVFFGDPIRLLGARAIAFDALIVATPIHRRPVQLCFPA